MANIAMESTSRSLTDEEKLAFQSFLSAHKRITSIIAREMQKSSPLSLEQYDVLVTLEYEDDGRLRMSDLAERVLLSKSGLTRLVDRLEAKGWVRREACDKDRRGAYAVLTDEGRRMREEAWPVLQEAMVHLFAARFPSRVDLRSFSTCCRNLAAEPKS